MHSLALISEMEKRVLCLAAEGFVDKEIAADLKISQTTVRTYWLRIKAKARTTTRTHAVAMSICAGIIEPEFPGRSPWRCKEPFRVSHKSRD